jgi:hypothetical protein
MIRRVLDLSSENLFAGGIFDGSFSGELFVRASKSILLSNMSEKFPKTNSRFFSFSRSCYFTSRLGMYWPGNRGVWDSCLSKFRKKDYPALDLSFLGDCSVIGSNIRSTSSRSRLPSPSVSYFPSSVANCRFLNLGMPFDSHSWSNMVRISSPS